MELSRLRNYVDRFGDDLESAEVLRLIQANDPTMAFAGIYLCDEDSSPDRKDYFNVDLVGRAIARAYWVST